MGIEAKQSDMKEMDKNMSITKMELVELEKTMRRRQMLLDLTSKEVEEGQRKLEVEKKRMEEERIHAREPINCMETVIIPEGQATRGSGILGLQVMGVFTLCGLLVALGWGE
jgi:hypothetical protein